MQDVYYSVVTANVLDKKAVKLIDDLSVNKELSMQNRLNVRNPFKKTK